MNMRIQIIFSIITTFDSSMDAIVHKFSVWLIISIYMMVMCIDIPIFSFLLRRNRIAEEIEEDYILSSTSNGYSCPKHELYNVDHIQMRNHVYYEHDGKSLEEIEKR